MYCVNCGKELVEGAQFCTACGSRTTAESPTMPAAVEAPVEKTGGVSAALSSGRSRSRLRITPLILLVLVLALTSAVAAASYYVYTQVYLPTVERGSYEAYDGRTDADGATGGEVVATYAFTYETAIEDDELKRFVYPVITSSEPNAALDALNESMKSEVLQAAANSTYTGLDTPYTALRYLVTYLDDGVVSIWRIESTSSVGMPHVNQATNCKTIDLRTGVEIDPATIIGVNREALIEATIRACSGLPQGISHDQSNAIRTDINEGKGHFFLVPGGIAYSFHSHDYGTTHGVYAVVVIGDGTLYSAGDAIGGYAIENTAKLPGFEDGIFLAE